MNNTDLEIALLHALKAKVVAEVRDNNYSGSISIEMLKAIIKDNATQIQNIDLKSSGQTKKDYEIIL